jgi:hypothetical protein
LRELVVRGPNARVRAGACTAHKCVCVCARSIYVVVRVSCAAHSACAAVLCTGAHTAAHAHKPGAPVTACARSVATGDTPTRVQRHWPSASRHGRVRACALFRAYTQVHECVSSQARCRESERQAPTARDVRGAMRGAQRSRQRTCPMGARHTDLARPGTCTRTRATHTCCCSQFGRVRVLFATGPALARRRQHHRRRRHCRHRRRLWISRYGARVVRPPPAAAPTRAYASTPLATPCEGTKSHQRLDLHLPNEF